MRRRCRKNLPLSAQVAMRSDWSTQEIADSATIFMGTRIASTAEPQSQLLLWHTCSDARPLLIESAIVHLHFSDPNTVALVHMFRHPVHDQHNHGWRAAYSTANWDRFCLVQSNCPTHIEAKQFLQTSGFMDLVVSRECKHIEVGCDQLAWQELFGTELSLDPELKP